MKHLGLGLTSIVRVGSVLNQLYLTYKTRVESDSGSIQQGSNTNKIFSSFANLMDNTLLMWSAVGGDKIRESGVYDYYEKIYDFSPDKFTTGNELALNGNFSSWTGDNPDDWSLVASEDANNYVTELNGAARIVSDGTYFGINQPILTVGKKYKVTFNVVSVNTGFNVFISGNLTEINSTGTKTIYATATSTANLGFYRKFEIGAVDFTIDNVSVKEVDSLPNDPVQTTEANQLYKIDGKIKGMGDIRFLTHSDVTFLDAVPWTVCLVINWNGASIDHEGIVWGGASYNDALMVSLNTLKYYTVINSSGSNYQFSNTDSKKGIGRNTIVFFISDGSGNLRVVDNKGNDQTRSGLTTSIRLNHIIRAYRANSIEFFNGQLAHYHVLNKAISDTERSSVTSVLNTIYPEMPIAAIGGYTFAKYNAELLSSQDGTKITKATDATDWATGAARWWHHTDLATGAIYGRCYNRAARDVIAANPPIGYHVATQAELETLAALGGNALKTTGTDCWATTGGTNSSGFNALGGSSINADGSFNTLKETASFWCVDSDNVLKVYHNSDVAEIVAAAANEGHSIRFVKDIDWL